MYNKPMDAATYLQLPKNTKLILTRKGREHIVVKCGREGSGIIETGEKAGFAVVKNEYGTIGRFPLDCLSLDDGECAHES